ncbi:hypothetical protein J132_07955, partial [Termitomyces sp. J132]
KFMPWYNGPYFITVIHCESSNVTVYVPQHDEQFVQYHTSKLLHLCENNGKMFLSCKAPEPYQFLHSILVATNILLRRLWSQYLVRYAGFGPEHNKWLPGKELETNAALNVWLEKMVWSDVLFSFAMFLPPVAFPTGLLMHPYKQFL